MFKRKSEALLKERGKNLKIDYTLIFLVVGLSLFGALMVYSGSAIVAVRQGNSPDYYFLRQLTWIALGLIAGYFTFRIDYHILAKFSLPLLVISIVLLVMVLIVNQGQDIKRWMEIGPFPLQPSELAKFSFLLYLSSWLAKHREKHEVNKKEVIHHIKYELLPFLMILGLVCGLILVQPDLDTTFMLGVTSFIVYFLSGSDVIHLIGSITTAAFSGLLAFIAMISASYRMERLQTFIDFWKNNAIPNPFSSGYQMRQVLIAVASGGWFGVGFGESRQKYHYLGETAFSDTIFAIFAEEFGIIGGIILVSLFIFLFLKGYKIAVNAQDRLGFLIAVSVTTWITLQAFLHIGSNLALLPLNGNTLPFFSYGGSSTIVNLMAMGLLLNVARFKGSPRAEPGKPRTALERRRKR